MTGKKITELHIGDRASFEKTISESDVYLYAGITGDFNPAHVNEKQSLDTQFKGRIAHGMLTAGLISTVLAMHLPGPGTIYLGQELKFMHPVRIGDTIRAEVEVVELDIEKNRVKLRTVCENQDNKVVLDGYAKVMAPR